jgi:hypothetical protein
MDAVDLMAYRLPHALQGADVGISCQIEQIALVASDAIEHTVERIPTFGLAVHGHVPRQVENQRPS